MKGNLKNIFIILFLILYGGENVLFAQKKILKSKFIQQFISSTKDTSRSARFMIIPVLGYSQETGLEYGISGIYNFYVDKHDTSIRTSSINTIATLTSEHKSNFKLSSDIWSPNNQSEKRRVGKEGVSTFNYRW